MIITLAVTTALTLTFFLLSIPKTRTRPGTTQDIQRKLNELDKQLDVIERKLK